MNQRIAINRQQRKQHRRESALRRKEKQERKIQRWLFNTRLSTASNSMLAVAKLALGVLTPSGLLCVSALFNIGMALSKHVAVKASSKSRLEQHSRTGSQCVVFNRRQSSELGDNTLGPGPTVLWSRRDGTLLGEYRSYKTIGIVLFASSMVFLLYSLYVMLVGVIVEYTLIEALIIATVTFTEIGMAVYGIKTTQTRRMPAVAATKLTNLASSMVSLVLTQAAILSFTTMGDLSFYNGISGILFGGIAALIGVGMIVHGGRYLKSCHFTSPT
jgi:divalent metal cation (Fe/Co/Zn/Cd) transporter